MNAKFRGTGVALVTPFTDSGEIDFEGLRQVIDHTINNNVEYLVSLGTTGESVTLSKAEKKQLLEFTIDQINGRVPLVAGFGGNNTAEIKTTLENLNTHGIDAILSVSPYYNKPTQEGIYQHFKAIAQSTDLPIILYNIPGRTSSNMTAETTLRLTHEIENIIGIKEASGDLNQIGTIVKHKPDGFFVVSGDDAITLPLIALGCDGVISVIANAFPTEFSEMVRVCLAGDFDKGRELHYNLIDIMNLLFVEGNPAGVKCVLDLIGICKPNVRLPLVPASADLRSRLEKLVHHSPTIFLAKTK